MICPHCQTECKSIVLETRQQDGDILRRRCCGSCGKNYTSAERPDLAIKIRSAPGKSGYARLTNDQPVANNNGVFTVWN